MVHVIPPKLGVLQGRAAAAGAGVHIAAVKGKKVQGNRRLGGVVTRALGVVFFKAGFGLPFGQGLAQGACTAHVRCGPALVAHAFPAQAVAQSALALTGWGMCQALELGGVQQGH